MSRDSVGNSLVLSLGTPLSHTLSLLTPSFLSSKNRFRMRKGGRGIRGESVRGERRDLGGEEKPLGKGTFSLLDYSRATDVR